MMKGGKKKAKGSKNKSRVCTESQNSALFTQHCRLPNGTVIKFSNADPNDALSSQGGLLFRLRLFEPSECRKLLALSASFDDWESRSDSVDGKTEHQHNIYDLGKGFEDGCLSPLCKALAETLAPLLCRRLGLEFRSLTMHWAFLRKYTIDGRTNFPVHRDTSAATVNILISDPNDFTGAELYVLGPEHQGVDRLSPALFRRSFPDAKLRRHHSVPYVQGEAVLHLGKRMHGVLPLTSGARLTLILMFLP